MWRVFIDETHVLGNFCARYTVLERFTPNGASMVIHKTNALSVSPIFPLWLASRAYFFSYDFV